jgi:hypothetical protein
MAKITLDVDVDKKNLRDNVVQAIDDLDLIIANYATLTLDQARQAIGKLAKHQKIIIKRLVQLL